MHEIYLFYNILYTGKTYPATMLISAEHAKGNLHLWLHEKITPFAFSFKYTRMKNIIILCELDQNSLQDEYFEKINGAQDMRPDHLKLTLARVFHTLKKMGCNPSIKNGGVINSFFEKHICHDHKAFLIIEPP